MESSLRNIMYLVNECKCTTFLHHYFITYKHVKHLHLQKILKPYLQSHDG